MAVPAAAGKASPCASHVSLRTAFLSLVIVVVSVCPPCPAGTIRHDHSDQQYLDYAKSDGFKAGGLFSIDRSGEPSTGSGVLVGDGRWVLTAAHLLTGTQGMSFDVGGRAYAADGWVAHPRSDGDFRRGYDLGLVRLAETVEGVAPAGLYRGRRELGLCATLVGFGLTGTGLTGAQPPAEADRLGRAGTNVIDGTADKLPNMYRAKLPRGARILITDFDSPTDPSVNTTGAAEPTDLELLISHGDSGGPLFIDAGDGLGAVVAGIHSYGEFRDERDDSDYGDVTGHTRVSPLRGWVDRTIRRDAAGRAVPGFFSPTAGDAALMELRAASSGDPSPNGGQLMTISSAGIISTGDVGFDISDTGEAFISTRVEGQTGITLYGANLATGDLDEIGLIGTAEGPTVFDIAAAGGGGATPIPLPPAALAGLTVMGGMGLVGSIRNRLRASRG